MKHPRLTRIWHFGLVAIAGLGILCLFPPARTHAANAVATIPAATQKALVNLKSRQTLQFTYSGSPDAVAALRMGTVTPTALAAADFDADGAMDVVAGYSTGSGGAIALLRGNPDAYAPKNRSLYRKALQGNVPSTFLSKASVTALPESPDLLVTGDFNRDGRKDVLVAARGGALYLLAGDGHGQLLAPQAVPLSGQVLAMAATGSGHVALSLDGSGGPRLLILSPGSKGLTAGATYPLPARGDSVAWGGLGGDGDLAVGAGANVVVIYNATSVNAKLETIPVPFQVKSLALGDFIWDRDSRSEISVLAGNGTIYILQHGTLNTAPLTAADIPGRRAALMAKKTKQAPNPTALGAWTLAKQLPYSELAPSGPVSPSAFSSPRLAATFTQDLMVLDAGRNELNILDTSGTAASASAGVSFSDTPVAALALPQKINAGRDIIVLTSGHAAPTLIPTGGYPASTVTWTIDEDDAGACTNTGVTSGGGNDGNLSLREAVCEANNNAPASSTITLNPGTYSLKDVESGELQVNANGSGYSLTISGSGPANTTIEQTDGVDRIIEEDYALSGGNPLTIQNVTLSGGNCTTGVDCGYGGGAIIAGGLLGDDLNLCNVVMTGNTNNSTVGDETHNGGAVSTQGPNLTVKNSSFSYNSAPGQQGGAIWYQDAVVTQATEEITNSSFANNTSGQGGALYVNPYVDPPSILGSATISGSTFTVNTANGSQPFFPYGGAIYAEAYETSVTVSNSRFADNSAEYGSGLAIVSTLAGVATDNWWGCNAGPGDPANDGPSESNGGTGAPINPGSPNPGCDTLYVDSYNSATLSYSPWLVLGIGAAPTQILASGSSTLTADLTHDSGGNGGFSVPDGTIVAFGGTLGTANPPSATTTGGQAISTFFAGAAGAGSGTATLDSQTVSVAITIGQSPSISSANNTTFTAGTAGFFSVTTTGFPAPSISENGALPSGVTLVNNGNGTATLSGTPASGTGGIYNITLTAQNGFTPNAVQNFALTVDEVSFTVSTRSVAFGDEELNLASAPMAVRVTNTGNVALPITSITLSGTNFQQFSQSNTCGTSVAVGSRCTISVVFTPSSVGSKSANLNLKSGADLRTVTLSGIGAKQSYTVAPTGLAFGNQRRATSSAPQPVTVTNTGAVALPITSITLSSTNYTQFSQTNNCGASVPVGSQCTISVVFKPGSIGSKSAKLNVKSGGAALQTVALSGTGTT